MSTLPDNPGVFRLLNKSPGLLYGPSLLKNHRPEPLCRFLWLFCHLKCCSVNPKQHKVLFLTTKTGRYYSCRTTCNVTANSMPFICVSDEPFATLFREQEQHRMEMTPGLMQQYCVMSICLISRVISTHLRHLNICSLRNKMEEVRRNAFVDSTYWE